MAPSSGARLQRRRGRAGSATSSCGQAGHFPEPSPRDKQLQASRQLPRTYPETPPHDEKLRAVLGESRFYSITYRLFKLDGLETLCEDYGQAVRYKGTMEGAEHALVLDDHHVFQTGKWYEVCGNTASMTAESWMRAHFDLIGDRSVHYGLFDCGGEAAGDTVTGGACAPGGGACC